MKIAIVCYASIGGSGIVATELAKCLAVRGHQVHVVSREQPFRLGDDEPGVAFRGVPRRLPAVPRAAVLLSLATRIARSRARSASTSSTRTTRSARHGGTASDPRSTSGRHQGRRDAHGTDITIGERPVVQNDRLFDRSIG